MRSSHVLPIAFVLACCARRSNRGSLVPIEASRVEADAAVLLSVADASTESPRTRHLPQDFAPRWTVSRASTPGRLDPSERLRLDDGAGGTVLPGDPDPAPRPLGEGGALYAGDRLEAGAPGLTLRDRSGYEIVLGADARAVIPTFGGSDVILTLGTLEVTNGASEPIVIDTPAIRFRVPREGRLRCAITDDGHVACAAITVPIEAWPSPPAPASTLGARVHRHAHSRAGHPISLDVNVGELVATARPLRPIELAALRVLTFGPDGAASSERPGSSSEAAFAAWRSRLDHRVARPTARLYPVSQLARAGTGDLADARALASGGDDFRLSAALARATARSERARALALRGGDVTALVPMAHLDEVLLLARTTVPIRATMLDTGERSHVP